MATRFGFFFLWQLPIIKGIKNLISIEVVTLVGEQHIANKDGRTVIKQEVLNIGKGPDGTQACHVTGKFCGLIWVEVLYGREINCVWVNRLSIPFDFGSKTCLFVEALFVMRALVYLRTGPDFPSRTGGRLFDRPTRARTRFFGCVRPDLT